MHGKWAIRIIGKRLPYIDELVDKLEIHDYPCRGEFYPYKALQFGYIVFKRYGCSSVKAMYLHCVMDSIDLFLKQKNTELRDKGYFTLNDKKCQPQSRLSENEWLWICVDKNNPYLGLTLSQTRMDELILKTIRARVDGMLENYLDAIEKAVRLVKSRENVNLPEELLKDIITVASNKEFIECAHKSIIELKNKLDNKNLFKEMVNDIASEAVTKVNQQKRRKVRRFL